MPLILTSEHDQAIREHAVRDYPHECCGFLLGSQSGPTTTVAATKPAGNARDDSPRNRFEIDAGELFRADRAARAQGLSVVGFYHSHPDAPARPSGYDRERAWPGYCYAIVSVAGARSANDGMPSRVAGSAEPREMTNWRLNDSTGEFIADPIALAKINEEKTT